MNDRFIRACRREESDATPVWFMRQAGRFLPEYRAIREKHSFLDICKNPELCAEVSTLPVDTLNVDAAILFADIMLPLEGMGVKFEIRNKVGPIISNPINDFENTNSLTILQPRSDVPYVFEAIAATKKRLDSRVPLIGFCGAPFTLASYLIEGHATRDFLKTKKLMYTDSKTWHLLMEKLSISMGTYLQAQIKAGVEAIQFFDSWVGCLSCADYHTYVLPYSRKTLSYVSNDTPCIHFGTGTASLLGEMKQAGGTVFGVDWRIPIDVAWQILGYDVAIQGNLDPAVLLTNIDFIKTKTTDILKKVKGRRGHIFNLGHGILADTPYENVAKLVDFVHENTRVRK